jgi:hypothetical protein
MRAVPDVLLERVEEDPLKSSWYTLNAAPAPVSQEKVDRSRVSLSMFE